MSDGATFEKMVEAAATAIADWFGDTDTNDVSNAYKYKTAVIEALAAAGLSDPADYVEQRRLTHEQWHRANVAEHRVAELEAENEEVHRELNLAMTEIERLRALIKAKDAEIEEVHRELNLTRIARVKASKHFFLCGLPEDHSGVCGLGPTARRLFAGGGDPMKDADISDIGPVSDGATFEETDWHSKAINLARACGRKERELAELRALIEEQEREIIRLREYEHESYTLTADAQQLRALIVAKDAEIAELNRVCAAAIAYRNAVVGGQTDRILITTRRELDASVRALSVPAVEASDESPGAVPEGYRLVPIPPDHPTHPDKQRVRDGRPLTDSPAEGDERRSTS